MYGALLVAAASGCGPVWDTCGDGVATPGEVCFKRGGSVDVSFPLHLIGDFDGDGIADVVGRLPTEDLEARRVFLNRGDASFAPSVELAREVDWYRVADFDGNGRDELRRPFDSSSSELWELEEGRLVARRQVPVTWDWQSVVYGDFDGDGVTDIVIGEPRLGLIRGTSEGGFDDVAWLEGEEEEPDLGPLIRRRPLVVGDLSGDGSLEVVVLEESVEVLSGANLERRVVVVEDEPATSMALADLDEEPGKELVVWQQLPLGYGTRYVRALSVRPEDGAIKWSMEIFLPAEGETVVVADLDGNGLDDLLLVAPRSRVLLTLPGQPFSEEVAMPVLDLYVEQQWAVYPAHLNDDGIVDFFLMFAHPSEMLLSNP